MQKKGSNRGVLGCLGQHWASLNDDFLEPQFSTTTLFSRRHFMDFNNRVITGPHCMYNYLAFSLLKVSHTFTFNRGI